MLKSFLFIIILLFTTVIFSQNITAFSDSNGKLYMFNKGQIKLVEFQRTKNLNIGNNYIAYSDSRGDYWVIWQGKKMKIAQGISKFYNSNFILATHYTSMLKIVDRDSIKTLTSYVNAFTAGDSVIVFHDKIGGNLKYYYNDSIVEFAQLLNTYNFTQNQIGSNVFAYGDYAGNYFAFQNHNFYPLFSANGIVNFSAGTNVIAYNDLENNTFNMYRNGEITTIDNQYALNYKAGNDFVYYKDQAEYENVYYKDESNELGFSLVNLKVKDSIITFYEAGYFKIWYNNEIYTIYNTVVKNSQIDGGIVAFTNNSGGVNAFVRGKEITITNQKVIKFELHGNTIILQFGPASFGVWWNGRIYQF